MKNKSLVLIVDDIDTNVEFITDILATIEGIETVGVNSGKAALNFMAKRKPDLILLDITMPRMDGFEVCTIIKNKVAYADIPIIFLTARVQKEDIVKAFEIGAVDYIAKPFNLLELISRVKTHLDLRKKTLELKEVNSLLEEKVRIRTVQLSESNNQLIEANKKLKDTYARLSKLDHAKSDFIAHINHELRTPLNVILGNISLLMEMDLNEEVTEFINTINIQVTRLVKMAEISLLFTELKLVDNQFKFEKIAVNQIIDNAINQEDCATKKIEIKYNNHGEPLLVYGESRLLTACLTVIIDNAIKYSPVKGTVEIIPETEGEFVAITVKDNGPGFSEKAKANAFELFLADNLDLHAQGFGVGLATAKKITDIMGGKLVLKNQPRNKGASVKVSLPKA